MMPSACTPPPQPDLMTTPATRRAFIPLAAIALTSIALLSFAGTLHAWLVEDGTTVEEGVTVAVLESMKMEVPVKAPRAGNLRQTTAASDTVTANGAIGFVEE